MKKLLLPVIFFALSLSLRAQVVSDTVHMNPGYADEVFYQLGSGARAHVPFSAWEIAFNTNLFSAAIRVNDGSGVTLYESPTADTTEFLTFDTAGYQSWGINYNSETSWEIGAFNAQQGTFPNFGWGTYDFNNTFNVYGEKIFLLKMPGGTGFKKIWIKEKTGTGNYIFRYANLDNSSDQTITINENNYASKSFVYYSIQNNQVEDLQPAKANWDIDFTEYFTYFPNPGIYIPVTGVFSNKGVTAAKAYPVDLNTVSYTDYTGLLDSNLSAIGWNWKSFDMYTSLYSIVDSLIYFVKAKDNIIFSLRFTWFSDTTGTVYFDTEKLLTGINEVNGDLSQAMIYPNPSSEQTTIVYDAKANAKVNAQLFDVSGRKVMQTFFEAHEGLNHETILLPALSQGMYQLVLNTGKENINLKVMVAK